MDVGVGRQGIEKSRVETSTKKDPCANCHRSGIDGKGRAVVRPCTFIS
jgi:hypothetical protein